MTYLEAAIAVLKTSRSPITTLELTRRAIEQGLLRPQGKTPKATMEAALYAEIARNPGGGLKRLSEAGPTRARRGSVRWICER